MRVWIPSPPQRVIGPDAYYPLEGGGVRLGLGLGLGLGFV